MPLDIQLSTAAVISLGALIQGVTGFGSALVSMPLLLLFLDAKTAVPLVILNGLLITGYLCHRLKAHLEWEKIGPLFIGSLPGVIAGALFLKEADESAIKLCLGAILTGYSLFGLSGGLQPISLSRAWGYVAGFGTGAIGAAFSAGGPPVIIYTTLTGWPKDSIKATLSGFFFINGIAIALAHIATGLTTGEVVGFLPTTLPGTLLGVALGSLFYGRMDKGTYLRCIYFLLILMGVLMIYSSLKGD